MVLDPSTSTIYVFGGRAITPDPHTTIYSGLYTYHIPSNRWQLIRSDSTSGDGVPLKGRIGHSMVIDDERRELLVLAGQRSKDYLSDFYAILLETFHVRELSRDYTKEGGPDAGFTQRAVVDTSRGELYLLSGLMRERGSAQETVRNSFWVYNLRKGGWKRVYVDHGDASTSKDKNEPVPRFAHQMVGGGGNIFKNSPHHHHVHPHHPHHAHHQNYAPSKWGGKFWLFGGNPGVSGEPELRLDDFWQLELSR